MPNTTIDKIEAEEVGPDGITLRLRLCIAMPGAEYPRGETSIFVVRDLGVQGLATVIHAAVEGARSDAFHVE